MWTPTHDLGVRLPPIAEQIRLRKTLLGKQSIVSPPEFPCSMSFVSLLLVSYCGPTVLLYSTGTTSSVLYMINFRIRTLRTLFTLVTLLSHFIEFTVCLLLLTTLLTLLSLVFSPNQV